MGIAALTLFVAGQYGTVIDAMWTLTVENLELPGNSKVRAGVCAGEPLYIP